MLQLTLSDDAGSCRAMVYHDVVTSLPFMQEDSSDANKGRRCSACYEHSFGRCGAYLGKTLTGKLTNLR